MPGKNSSFGLLCLLGAVLQEWVYVTITNPYCTFYMIKFEYSIKIYESMSTKPVDAAKENKLLCTQWCTFGLRAQVTATPDEEQG